MDEQQKAFSKDLLLAAHWKLVQPSAFHNCLTTFLLLFFLLKPSPDHTRQETDGQQWQGLALACLRPSHGSLKVQDRQGPVILGWISAREPGADAREDVGRWLLADIRDLQLATELADS